MVYSKDKYHEIIEINKSSCLNMIKNIINKMLAERSYKEMYTSWWHLVYKIHQINFFSQLKKIAQCGKMIKIQPIFW